MLLILVSIKNEPQRMQRRKERIKKKEDTKINDTDYYLIQIIFIEQCINIYYKKHITQIIYNKHQPLTQNT